MKKKYERCIIEHVITEDILSNSGNETELDISLLEDNMEESE